MWVKIPLSPPITTVTPLKILYTERSVMSRAMFKNREGKWVESEASAVFPVEAADIIEATLELSPSARAVFFQHAPPDLIEQVALWLDFYEDDSREAKTKSLQTN